VQWCTVVSLILTDTNSYFHNSFSSDQGFLYYLDLTKQPSGEWLWTETGHVETLDSGHWATGHPQAGNDCAGMYFAENLVSKIHTVSCSTAYLFICGSRF